MASDPDRGETSIRQEKQWQEHLQFEAARPLSVEESEEVIATVPPERILDCRFLYRDKNRAKRRMDKDLGRRKKDFCIAGQRDPDRRIELSDAPTVSRHSIGLETSVPFLNGLPSSRGYFRQPKRGIPSLQPGQVIEVLKGVFGLSASPTLWWMKLSCDLTGMEVDYEGEKMKFQQNVFDPCVFMLENKGVTKVLLLTHVDDVMLMAETPLLEHLQKIIGAKFPIDDWDNDEFEHVGCEYECQKHIIEINQTLYSSNRVEKITIPEGDKDDQAASAEQKEENRTAIGCLSWLAKQTRPDLQFSVCQCQKKQQVPTITDLKNTNKVVSMSEVHKDKGLRLHRVNENMCIVAFHDAVWGNAGALEEEAGDQEWFGDHSLILVADRSCTWQVQHSGSEKQSIVQRSLLLSMALGLRVEESRGGEHTRLHLITDCRSLYDHIHREGVPRAPSEKRLAIDLAGLRQGLMVEARHQWKKKYQSLERPSPQVPLKPPLHWVPTSGRLADLSTKQLKSNGGWDTILQGHLALPLKGVA